ncbi:MAG: ThiF family adenylyltransferase [Phycisphaerales bacterium]|nr:ThiF family adenylyltransferase [Phycisphaerales bacterium]
MARYSRQELLPDIGLEGQHRIASAKVLIVGVGALGCGAADLLARAGVGTLRIVDRDVVELTNLQRQVLFDQADAEACRPKALAAAERLKEINPEIRVEPCIEDVRPENILSLSNDCDLILDGLDNFETRYLINDVAVKTGLPYIYAGAIGTEGLVMPILPKSGGSGSITWPESEATPCLRCVFPEPPSPGSSPTCDTAGILGPTIGTVAAHQSAIAMSLLVGRLEQTDRSLHTMDPWNGINRRMATGDPRSDCPCCEKKHFEWLDGNRISSTDSICGREVVQIRPRTDGSVDLLALRTHLKNAGDVRGDTHAVQVDIQECDVRMTIFEDGRALVGVSDISLARTLYDRYIGA